MMADILQAELLIRKMAMLRSAKGEGDFWVVKLNAQGAVVWKQIYGGSETDYLRASYFKPETREYYHRRRFTIVRRRLF